MRRILATFSAAVAAVAFTTSPAAAGEPPDGSSPFPGYTVDNPPLLPVLTAGGPTRVVQGVHNHAAFDFEVPPDWNGELVVFAHGFRGDTKVLSVDPPPFGLRETFVNQGLCVGGVELHRQRLRRGFRGEQHLRPRPLFRRVAGPRSAADVHHGCVDGRARRRAVA